MSGPGDGPGVSGQVDKVVAEAKGPAPRWDVLSSPLIDHGPMIEQYVPPSGDGSDPIDLIIVERHSRGWYSVNAATVVGGVLWLLCFLGLSPWILVGPGYGWPPDPPAWLLAAEGPTFAIGAVAMVAGGLRRRGGRRSAIRLTREDLRVTTEAGGVERIAWSDMAVLRMYRSSLGADKGESAVHLRWQSLFSGESVDIVLGAGIDARRLRSAIASHRMLDDYHV